MLKPITKKMTDESNGGTYRFTFYCDICGNPHQSASYSSEGCTNPLARENEHIAAYERANREVIMHFNRCPVCGRIVCDKCFKIFDVMDMCKECAAAALNARKQTN